MNECADLSQRLWAISQAATCLFVILLVWGMFTVADWAHKITPGGDDDPPTDGGRPRSKTPKGK